MSAHDLLAVFATIGDAIIPALFMAAAVAVVLILRNHNH